MIDTKWLTVTVLAQDVCILFGFIIFLLNPKAGRKEFFLLGLLLLITLVGESIGTTRAIFLGKNANIVYSVSFLLILPLFLMFYKSKMNSKQVGRVLDVAITAFLVFGIVNLFFIQGTANMNSYTNSVGTITLMAISIVYFYFLLKELPTETITKLPMFWVNTAVLIYYSGTFIQYLAADYLITVLKDDLINSWTLHNFLGILHYLMLAFALWVNRSNLLHNPTPRVNTIP